MHSARELLTRFNEPGGLATTFAGQVAEAARQQAASMPPQDLVALFTVTAPQVLAAVEAAGPIVVDYFGTARIPLDEALSTAGTQGARVASHRSCRRTASSPFCSPSWWR